MENAKIYWRYRIIIIILDVALSLFFFLLVQLTGLTAIFRQLSSYFSANFYASLTAYLFIIGALYYLISFPLNFYGSFILEKKFALSSRTVASWVRDEIKKCIISAVLILFLTGIIYFIARNTGAYWWMICAAFWVTFSVIFAKIFPVVIIPIFYKYKPLSDNSLRKRILSLAEKFRIKVLDVFEIDFSKNTKKSNAALTGMGGTKRVILADNLINEFTPEEVEVVMAHEMAHYKLGHIWKLLLFGAVSTFLLFFIMDRSLPYIASALGFSDIFDIALFPAICVIYIAYSFLSMPVNSAISCYFEREADTMALKMTGLKDSFISLMNKLADKNLSDRDPNRIVEIFFYDHPPIKKRIEMAENFVK